MPYSSTGKNAMLDGIGITHCSLHSDIPNDAGSNEISGGSYARQAITFLASSGGVILKNATDPVFSVPASTVAYIGLWSALTGGIFKGWAPINGGTVKGVGTGKATGDVVTSHVNGLANDDRVALEAVLGEALPTGLNITTLYHIVGVTADTFQLSATQGGAAVTITGDGELRFQKTIPEVFGSPGNVTVDTASLDLNG